MSFQHTSFNHTLKVVISRLNIHFTSWRSHFTNSDTKDKPQRAINSKMLPPLEIPVPPSTTNIYITAISLSPSPSEVSVSWSDDSATYGTTFTGPSSSYVLGDKVFKSPITTIDGSIPEKLIVGFSFDFNDTMPTQHSVTEPVTKLAGPAGSSTVVQVSEFAAEDREKKFPTTVTIVMKRPMRGIY